MLLEEVGPPPTPRSLVDTRCDFISSLPWADDDSAFFWLDMVGFSRAFVAVEAPGMLGEAIAEIVSIYVW